MDWKSENNFPDEFHGVACEVYRGDPNWIPESPGMLKLAFGPHNRYFDKNSAWIGCEPDMARLAGFYNPDLLINDQHVAFFGYWETIDAYHANRKLFSEFESWARDKGAVTVYGPINFTTFGSYRIRLDRFEDGCYPGEPYNPPYYPRFLEDLGFKIAYRYMTLGGDLHQAYQRSCEISKDDMKRADENGIVFVPLTHDFLLKSLESLYELVDAVFSGNFAYTKISSEEFKAGFGATLARNICPESSVLALDSEGNIAGFFINLPDYGLLCRQGAPNRIAPGQLEYGKHFQFLMKPTLLLKTVGIQPKWRNQGLFTVMVYFCMKWALPHYSRCAGATMREDNYSLNIARRVFEGCDDIKRHYGLFAKSL